MKHLLHKKIENYFIKEYIVKESGIYAYMNYKYTYVIRAITQPAATCSTSTRETPGQCEICSKFKIKKPEQSR